MFFFPKIFSGVFAVNLVIHSLFKEDSPKDFLVIEGRTLDNAGTHLVDKVEHFGIVLVGAFLYTVEFQSFRSTSSTLVKGSDEAFAVSHFFYFFFHDK